MNLYFLLEGSLTEPQVYEAWLQYLLPEFQRVETYNAVQKQNYYLESGNGYPYVLRLIRQSIEDINEVGNYDYFIICVDADEETIEDRETDIRAYIDNLRDEEGIELDNTEVLLIIQNRCIETWFLGNREIHIPNPRLAELRRYTEYYDVSADDPELMGKFDARTHARFHARYLKILLRQQGKRYSKNSPQPVMEEKYLQQLQARVTDQPTHLQSLQRFFTLCQRLSAKEPKSKEILI